VIDGLTPPELAAGGLVSSVRAYAALAGRTHGTSVTVRTGDLPPLDPQQDTAIYRVAQEAIGNALRHSGAGRVTVNLAGRQRTVVLEVSDDGVGFDPASPAAGLGLTSMRERARSVGGKLTITSGTGAGTKVRLSAPASASRAADRQPAGGETVGDSA
jgi:signal transduction histidine kinase